MSVWMDEMRTRKWLSLFGLVLSAALASSAQATTLTTGGASIAYDLAVWAGYGLSLERVIGADGNALPVGPVAGEDLLDTTLGGPVNPGFYGLNPQGIDVTPLEPRRAAPVTSFTYDVGTLPASASGDIALAGVTRWSVDPLFGGGSLLIGDFSLAYAAGVWQLSNNIDFQGVVFTLGDAVLTTGPGDAFSVSGSLIGTAFLGFLLPGAEGLDFGDFTFSSVPEPSASALLVLLAAVLPVARRMRIR
jgi:hypothetical protein